MSYKLGIDVGGTCIDLVLLNEATGELAFEKLPIVADNVFAGIRVGIGELLTIRQLTPADVTTIVHGTTLVADCIQHHTGALTGLIVSRGQEDLPETGRDAWEDRYDINSPSPAPLIPRLLRRGVVEEIDSVGTVLTPLTDEAIERAVDELAGRGIEAIAVSLVNAVANSMHEEQIGAYIRQTYPDLAVSLSSDITTDYRPYERLTATALNAYTQPPTMRYLTELRQHLTEAGLGAPLYLMTSEGNLTTTDAACRVPIELLESGPVGSTLLSTRLSQRMGRANLLSFDMGGTSAQLSLIANGIPQRVDEFEVSRVRRFKKGTGLPMAASGIELTEIGAGAASLAYIDESGKLRVGPESAPPETGPACYGRGGTRPTVTDADLVLGYISEAFFRGQTLSRGAARRALLEHIALPLDIGVEEAARSVHRLANETMANAAMVYLLEKGYDPRQYSLLASGGAGPIHGFGVARLLGTADVIVPAGAGVTSTLGLMLAPLVSKRSYAYVSPLANLDYDRLNALMTRLEQEGRALLLRANSDPAGFAVTRTVDVRYAGQQLTETLPVPAGRLSPDSTIAWQRALAGSPGTDPSVEEVDVEAVTWRVLISQVLPTVPETPVLVGSVVGRGDFSGLKGYRQVVFMDDDFPVSCPVYDGNRIQPGDCLSGPVIIEEAETTVVVGRKAYARMDSHRNLTITLR
ncbi:MAG: hydantoinase/oxoprolinase family protein [Bacteroidetes bacterium]|nr:hydantoinase/oxoprolinase family protein [Fibrella sp.]